MKWHNQIAINASEVRPRNQSSHKRQHDINRRLRVLPTCPEWLRLSHRARDTAATMLHHSRHRGESATKTVKFFIAQTVNYVICNNHARIEWVLLYFTPSYSAELSPTGPKVWQIILRSWQVDLSTWVVKIRNQPIQKRSCFWYRKLCAFNLLSWGLNVVLRYSTSSDFCVNLLRFYGPVMCRNRPDVSNNIFMRCLHLLRRYFAPLPWWFLTQPELQQGSDRLNCNQKHVLMLYAIKINCIYINEQVVSIFLFNSRSDS